MLTHPRLRAKWTAKLLLFFELTKFFFKKKSFSAIFFALNTLFGEKKRQITTLKRQLSDDGQKHSWTKPNNGKRQADRSTGYSLFEVLFLV